MTVAAEPVRLDELLSVLRERPRPLLDRLFTPAPTVQPGWVFRERADLGAMFDAAQDLFRRGAFSDAMSRFLSASSAADSVVFGTGRHAQFNAAACGCAAGDYAMVVDLLEPYYRLGTLYGLPSWNLALAYYRLNRLDAAVEALRAYLSRAFDAYLPRGLLVEACLATLAGDSQQAEASLSKAVQSDDVEVRRLLRISRRRPGGGPGSSFTEPDYRSAVDAPGVTITPAVRAELSRLLLPQRPNRSPALSGLLSLAEMDRFTRALEAMAEGDYRTADTELTRLNESYPNQPLLQVASAANELFLGRADHARALLQEAEHSGTKLSGGALWNLACAQFRLGDFGAAHQALLACSRTEYRTKPELYRALKLLGETGLAQPEVPPAENGPTALPQGAPSQNLLSDLPESVPARRREVLSRLIRPGRPPRAFRPDLSKLQARERSVIVSILDAAHRAADHAQAASVLLPHIEQFSNLYTLHAHTAAFCLLAGDSARAETLLLQAQRLWRLDEVSRRNLAAIQLNRGDVASVLSTLEGGIGTSFAEKHVYWLAVAIARELVHQPQSGVAAARAVALSENGPQGAFVKQVLQAVDIKTTGSPFEADPHVEVAQRALSLLAGGQAREAAECLDEYRVLEVRNIQEIGPQILEPRFISRVAPGWDWDEQNVRRFEVAVEKYQAAQYSEAAIDFQSHYDSLGSRTLLVNAAAALLKDNQPSKARAAASRKRVGRRRGRHNVWLALCNEAIAYSQLRQESRAIQLIQARFRAGYIGERESAEVSKLIVAIAAGSQERDSFGDTLSEELGRLAVVVHSPSNGLLLAIALANLLSEKPNIEKAESALRRIIAPDTVALQPPADVSSMQKVREAYDHFSRLAQPREAYRYLASVVDARVDERHIASMASDRSAQLEHLIGVEFEARVCQVRAQLSLNDRERAALELAESETLLIEQAEHLSKGHLARDWSELVEVAMQAGLPVAAARYCHSALRADPENATVSAKAASLAEQVQAIERELIDLVRESSQLLAEGAAGANELPSHMKGPMERAAPLLCRELFPLLERVAIQEGDDEEIDEVCERARTLAKLELPASIATSMEEIISWIDRTYGGSQLRIPVEVTAWEGILWPRPDVTQGCCLLVVNARADVSDVTIHDRWTDREIWGGDLKARSNQYVRWVFERNDGFAPGDFLDLPILIRRGLPGGSIDVGSSISVGVASSEAQFASFPSGALSPADAPGGELYGRSSVIARILRGLGKTRSNQTFFVEGPRRMGKTSVLNFVKEQMPEHVMAVYLNLEAAWDQDETANLWRLMALRVCRELDMTPDFGPGPISSDTLVSTVMKACQNSGKTFVFFLLDEFNFMFERSANPQDVLAMLREFQNQSDKRISLLYADRYTKQELEEKCDSGIWLQVTELPVGPLSRTSMEEAIAAYIREQAADIRFLPEATSRIYELTSGYPLHFVNLAQHISGQLLDSGPWVTVLPRDVDDAVDRIVSIDRLFTEGLCRPDRIDTELAEAIAALLEWRDLLDLLPSISRDPEWQATVGNWQPSAATTVHHLGKAETILERLERIGVMRRVNGKHEFFSPLLEHWLRKMRSEGRALTARSDASPWAFLANKDAFDLDGREWLALDAKLVTKCRNAQIPPPLRVRAAAPDFWDQVARPVTSLGDYSVFVNAIYGAVVDREYRDGPLRGDPKALVRFPWLLLAYQRIRAARHRSDHPAGTLEPGVQEVWDQLVLRALGRRTRGYVPSTDDDVRALQAVILRSLHAGLVNAIETVETFA